MHGLAAVLAAALVADLAANADLAATATPAVGSLTSPRYPTSPPRFPDDHRAELEELEGVRVFFDHAVRLIDLADPKQSQPLLRILPWMQMSWPPQSPHRAMPN